jgi:flagellar biosynthesis regulator FlaF
MNELDPRLQQASEAREAGRFEEALQLLRAAFLQNDSPAVAANASHFMTMFLWQMLAEDHAPARAALAELRDAQVDLVLAGDEIFAASAGPSTGWPVRRSRFSDVVEINEILGDPASTHALFTALESARPEQARRNAARALAHLVAAGDFALADRYRGDPLAMLEPVTLNARSLPLFPPQGQAPRLAAEMIGLGKDVHLAIAVLNGLGRPGEAEALRATVFDRLESAELREWMERELAEPGAINRAHTERLMALHPRAG